MTTPTKTKKYVRLATIEVVVSEEWLTDDDAPLEKGWAYLKDEMGPALQRMLGPAHRWQRPEAFFVEWTEEPEEVLR